MVKNIQSNPNLVNLSNGKTLNFESFGGSNNTELFKRYNIEQIISPNYSFYRERQLGIYNKLAPIIEGIKNSFQYDFAKACKEFVSIYLKSARSYIETQHLLDTIDIFDDNNTDAVFGIAKFREQLKSLFGIQNLIIAYNVENKNLFDIYLDAIKDPEDITTFDVLDFSFANNTIKFAHPKDIMMTIFICPKKMKELMSAFILENKDNFANYTLNTDTVVKVIEELFISSFITALVQDRYRELRLAQYTLIMNITKYAIENKMAEPFNVSSDRYRVPVARYFLYQLQEKYDAILTKFNMKKTDIYEYLSPNFQDISNKFDLVNSWSRCNINPLVLYQILCELPDGEITEFLTRFNIKNTSKEYNRISTLTKRSSGRIKNPEYIDNIRTTIALNRLIPLMYYITYIVQNGVAFKTTEVMIKEIHASLEIADVTAMKGVMYNALTFLTNKIRKYESVFGVLFHNPLNTQKSFIQFIFHFLTTDKIIPKEEIKGETA